MTTLTSQEAVQIAITKLNSDENNILIHHHHRHNVVAGFVTGSHLRNITTPDSDFDLILITDTNLEDELTNQYYSAEFKISDKIEGKLMDVRKLYSLILKSNPNITELFLKPVYINMKPEFRAYRNLFYSLNPEINSDAEKVWQIDRVRYCKSVGGMLWQAIKETKHKHEFRIKRYALLNVMLSDLNSVVNNTPIICDQSLETAGKIRQKAYAEGQSTMSEETVLSKLTELKSEQEKLQTKLMKQVNTSEFKLEEENARKWLLQQFVSVLNSENMDKLAINML